MKQLKLNQREKMAVGLGGGALVLFVLLQFVVFPLLDGRAKLAKRLATREKAVAEMRLLQEQYRKIGQQTGSLATLLAERSPEFSLFSFLEEKSAASEVKELIAYMKPSESTEHDHFKQSQVEMRLQGVGLAKLVAFLEQIEAPDQLVGIDKIAIQDNSKEEGTLDVTLTMVSVDRAGGEAAP
ncbi:MAG: type II secretion system protein M [Desulfobulbus sp.]|jgi:general secretion pathway protein M|uniref:type 4a pilus biogenesis protein PilO n=1 Tax=Desulfobulbus sp. TaxID=895 RepID=UPI00284BCC2F|nr:type 4a pilus biogenesis protein PilO [Desulfobulbus sp.]MDR2548855.1 type II secretion system protein M [Desulfobulbus sp.]